MLKRGLTKIHGIRFVAIFLLLAFLFICKGVGINAVLYGGMPHDIMPCCDSEETSVMFGGSMDKFVAPLPDVIASFAVLFIIFIFLAKSFSAEYKFIMHWYGFWLRRRFGSTQMFNFLNILLSLGILHPKLF